MVCHRHPMEKTFSSMADDSLNGCGGPRLRLGAESRIFALPRITNGYRLGQAFSGRSPDKGTGLSGGPVRGL